MKKLFISTCAVASIAAGTALADFRTEAGPGVYKDENGYSSAFPGADRWMPTSKALVTEHQTTMTTTRQRALVPESAGELQSRPTEQIIVIEPRGGYNMEGSRDVLR